MNTSKIDLLTQELSELEAERARGGPAYLDAQIALCKRRLRWHLMRATPKKHPNVGTASLCDAGRPKKSAYSEAPLHGLPASL
jgi:hypothetical protein